MNVYIIAGPNGSGKTTFAQKFLPNYVNCPNFINADMIAKGLSPFQPRLVAIQAGKIVIEQIHNFMKQKKIFAFETTLAGKTYLKLFTVLKKKGYKLHCFFLWIPSCKLANARIKQRVAEGGHDVPAADVKRRFYRGIQNFFTIYKKCFDSSMIFDNSQTVPKLVSEEISGRLRIINKELYRKISKTGGGL